ncbi:MAG: hypothetical protein RO257_14050 [Candidatus Kapabacteria bacterium]|nr:hypothetical protein [Candidatus Kapabacteria bacterium]
MENTISQPLTNVQIELLKAFSHKLHDNEIMELRKQLTLFFAKRLIKEADKVWDENAWDDCKINELLNSKLRKRN